MLKRKQSFTSSLWNKRQKLKKGRKEIKANTSEAKSKILQDVLLPKPQKEKQPSSDIKDSTIFASTSWVDFSLSPRIVACLEKRMHLSTPTVVQSSAIPVLLQQKDALIKAQTGSGKTLSYVLPIVQELQSITPKITRMEGTYGTSVSLELIL